MSTKENNTKKLSKNSKKLCKCGNERLEYSTYCRKCRYEKNQEQRDRDGYGIENNKNDGWKDKEFLTLKCSKCGIEFKSKTRQTYCRVHKKEVEIKSRNKRNKQYKEDQKSFCDWYFNGSKINRLEMYKNGYSYIAR